jgi:hypothetical protein
MKLVKLGSVHITVILLLTGAHGGEAQEKPNPPPPPPSPPSIPSWEMPGGLSQAFDPEANPQRARSSSERERERASAEEIEEAKLRKAASERIFKYQRVTLKETGEVLDWGVRTYSVRAFFTVDGQSVAIRCVSWNRAVVVAFLEYITRTFKDNRSADLSLEMIVAGARQDIGHRQDLSDAEITLQYFDQFDKTHVVQIPRHPAGLIFATR